MTSEEVLRMSPYAELILASLLASEHGRFAIRNPRRGHHRGLLLLPDVLPLAGSGKRAWREAFTTILRAEQP
jgi:hypothetical protein